MFFFFIFIIFQDFRREKEKLDEKENDVSRGDSLALALR
jgi:hypothetical protein